MIGLPFLRPDDYDRLLWSCDLNFVRGEDSAVRAQWARRPFVWQLYPQEGGIHLGKLEAFLALYLQALDPPTAAAARRFFQAWNGDPAAALAWPGMVSALPVLQAHADYWQRQLSALPELSVSLVEFVRKIG